MSMLVEVQVVESVARLLTTCIVEKDNDTVMLKISTKAGKSVYQHYPILGCLNRAVSDFAYLHMYADIN